MTVPQRLLAVPALAGVLYLSVIVAGLSGFDTTIWALYTVLFLVWHLLMHLQGPPLSLVVLVHGAVAAAFLGLGALIGQWVDFAPHPLGALAVGTVAAAVARLVRLSPEDVIELAARAEKTRAQDGTSPSKAQGADPARAAPSLLKKKRDD